MIRPVGISEEDNRTLYGFTGRGLLGLALAVAMLLGVAVPSFVLSTKAVNRANDAIGRLRHEIAINCADNRTIANIEQTEVRIAAANNKAILPKISIPGISHAELVALTERQTHEREHRAMVLIAVAGHVCHER